MAGPRAKSDAASRLRQTGAATQRYPKADFARFCSKGGIDWAGILDYVRDRSGFVEDKQLSKHLDVPSSTLSAVRKGNAELSMLAKFRLLDRFGYHLIAEAAELLDGDEIAAKQRRAARRERASPARGAQGQGKKG
jgi:hypothetical protein